MWSAALCKHALQFSLLRVAAEAISNKYYLLQRWRAEQNSDEFTTMNRWYS
jgi:hypothetical protein